MAASVFTKFDIYALVKGGTIITWDIHPMFHVAAPWTFTIQASRSGVGDWETVGTVVDTYIFTDDNQWRYGKAPRWHYRVILTAADASTYESCVKQVLGNLNARDTGILSEIIRKEQLKNRGYSGICGYIFKRRRWGTPCPDCRDYDSGEVINANCETCFGTGFVGGYFPGVCYWVSEASKGVNRRTTTQSDGGQGVIGDRVWPARGLNCPWLDSGDVWVNADTDERFKVNSVQELTYRGIVFVFDPIELRLAPATDIIYSLIRPDEEPVSSSN